MGESLYVTRIEELGWGAALIAITMVLHGFGMLGVLRAAESLKHRFEQKPSFTKGILILILVSWIIVIVNVIEVSVWARFFLVTGAVNADHSNLSLCYYVALMDYTTLGCEYNLVLHWRLLAGFISMAGLMTFAWSTGVLLTLAQEFQEQQLKLLRERREHRRRPAS